MNLTKALDDGYHLLVIVKQQAFLARPGAVFMGVNVQDAWAHVYDLGAMWRIFNRNVGSGDRVFQSAEVAIMAGVSKAGLHAWIRDGLVRPNIRLGGEGTGRGKVMIWDHTSAFLASVAGCLRRSGVNRDTVKRVMGSLRGETVETIGTGEAITCQN